MKGSREKNGGHLIDKKTNNREVRGRIVYYSYVNNDYDGCGERRSRCISTAFTTP